MSQLLGTPGPQSFHLWCNTRPLFKQTSCIQNKKKKRFQPKQCQQHLSYRVPRCQGLPQREEVFPILRGWLVRVQLAALGLVREQRLEGSLRALRPKDG